MIFNQQSQNMLNKQTILILLACVATVSSRYYPTYKQCDDRWAFETLGTSLMNTICSAGSMTSSVAMALKGINRDYNPSTLNTWLNSHSGYVSREYFVWTSINALGVKFIGYIGRADIASNLEQDNIVIIKVRSQGGHWVLGTGMISATNVAVNDPQTSTASYTFDQIEQTQIGMYRVGNSFPYATINELEAILKVEEREDNNLQSQ